MTETPQAKAEKSENKPLPKNNPLPPGDIRRRSKAAKRQGPFVKYVGQASSRKITPTQWATLDIPLKDATKVHTWSVANDKMIESSEFSDEQLDYLLIDDMQVIHNSHAFVEVDYDKDGNLVQVVSD
jgi:hypothetical protein